MGNFNNICFTDDKVEENNFQVTLSHKTKNCLLSCYEKNNIEINQRDLSHNARLLNNENRIKKLFNINKEEEKNNIIEFPQGYINNVNNNDEKNNTIKNSQRKANINNNIYNNQEKLSNNNIANTDNRILKNENILSFMDRIFPKRNKIEKKISPIIPPGTKGPFVENVSEKITFIKEGQFIQVKMDLKIINFPPNQLSISYGISFESQIYDVHCNLENNYEYNSHNIKFHYKLKNNESIHIEFDYKKLNQNICEYYRSEFISISEIFGGAVGKYEVIIPDNYILICEENEIFYPVNKSTYAWSGVIPKEGLKEWFKISYKRAKWQAQFSQEIESMYINDHISMAEITIPKYYKGGNIELEKYEIRCSLGSGVDNKCIFDEENTYRIKMENVASDKVFYQIISTFHNNVLSNWIIDIEDEKKITNIEDEIKVSFKPVVNHILENDKSSNPIFFKIGKFVHNYLTYDKAYSGKEMDVYQIYNGKRGVCEHFTLLYNTLLNSIDIPAIYVCGLANNGEGGKTQINDMERERHAWTLAKIEGRWIPLDATWGIFKGILPVSHIFQHYFKTTIQTKFAGKARISEPNENIVYHRL